MEFFPFPSENIVVASHNFYDRKEMEQTSMSVIHELVSS